MKLVTRLQLIALRSLETSYRYATTTYLTTTYTHIRILCQKNRSEGVFFRTAEAFHKIRFPPRFPVTISPPQELTATPSIYPHLVGVDP